MSIFSSFKRGLQKTATALSRTVTAIFTDEKPWDAQSYAQIEESLLRADFGVQTTKKLVSDIRDRYERGLIKTSADITATLSADIEALLGQGEQGLALQPSGTLTVILLVGVNGSGKTTTAGKLAYLYGQAGKKVMLAPCDTFRAAAVEQLMLWAQRTQCAIIPAKQGADPAAVAFDAVSSALAKKMDILIIDTAGRQHTKKGLMEELAKVVRVIKKQMPEAPHHVLLTLDASVGGNALAQAREFSQISGVTGLVLTKLDGTGRGGIIVAVHEELKLPVCFAGLGEQPEDLQAFNPSHYVRALFAPEEE